MGHDERQERCDLPVHPAGTHPGVVVKETVPRSWSSTVVLQQSVSDILNPAPDSFTVQGLIHDTKLLASMCILETRG